VGISSTSTFSGISTFGSTQSPAFGTQSARYTGMPGLGVQFAQAVEAIDTAAVCTFIGNANALAQSGLNTVTWQ
jgi:hypothetical protein